MDAILPPAAPPPPATGMLVVETGEGVGFAALLAGVLADAVPQDSIATLASPDEAAPLTEGLAAEPGSTLPTALPLTVPSWPIVPQPGAMPLGVETAVRAATPDGALPDTAPQPAPPIAVPDTVSPGVAAVSSSARAQTAVRGLAA
jgi:hypothetical protein